MPFPALDAEPPPRSWQARASIVAATTIVALALAGAGYGIASWIGSGGGRGPAGARVVVLTGDGQLGLVTPGSARVVVFPLAGEFQAIPPAVSADGRFLVGSNGTIVALSTRGLSVAHTAVTIDASRQRPSYANPLADRDRAVVIIGDSPLGPDVASAPITVTTIDAGRVVALGTGIEAAGDPQALGAFVSVAAPGIPPATSEPSQGEAADSRVERRDAGQPPVLLGTASSLEKALGARDIQPVSLEPVPDATGDLIAIAVSPTSGSGQAGLVVVDRAGHVRAVLPPASGVGADSGVVWSPDGTALAFGVALPSGQGAGVGVWTVGHRFSSRVDPNPAASPAGCQWSPDGAPILCDVLLPGDQVGLVEAGAAGGPLTDLAAPGQVLAWLPQPSRTAGSR